MAMVIATFPIVLPLVAALGDDCVWFGLYPVLMWEPALICALPGIVLWLPSPWREHLPR